MLAGSIQRNDEHKFLIFSLLQDRLQEIESRLILSEHNAENLQYELELAQQREAELISISSIWRANGAWCRYPMFGSSRPLTSQGGINSKPNNTSCYFLK